MGQTFTIIVILHGDFYTFASSKNHQLLSAFGAAVIGFQKGTMI